jgi:polyhydroxybutyrate depolymerase
MLVAGLIAAGCSGSEDDAGPVELPDQFVFGGDRPVSVEIPASYDHRAEVPLVVVLHGHGASGFVQAAYSGMRELVEEQGVLLIAPEGTIGSDDKQFWNATDACCDFFNLEVDDSAYLRSVIDDVVNAYPVDPQRVYVFGHSNGGFMAHRLACDHAEAISGIVSIAGASFLNEDDCQPTQPVHVLQIHGTEDTVIDYNGGETLIERFYPGAKDTVSRWAQLNGCDIESAFAGTLNLDSGVPGDETVRTSFSDGCDPGGSAELWTITGGGHIPSVTEDFVPQVIEYLFAHVNETDSPM